MDDKPTIVTMQPEAERPYPWREIIDHSRAILRVMIDRFGHQPEQECAQYTLALAMIVSGLGRGVGVMASKHQSEEAYAECQTYIKETAASRMIIVPHHVVMTAQQVLRESMSKEPGAEGNPLKTSVLPQQPKEEM